MLLFPFTFESFFTQIIRAQREEEGNGQSQQKTWLRLKGIYVIRLILDVISYIFLMVKQSHFTEFICIE